jgi:ribonuclease HII
MSLKRLWIDDGMVEVGLDEAGRGTLYGRLYVGAAILSPEDEAYFDNGAVLRQIKDSKTLSPKRRADLYGRIKELSTGWGVGFVSAEEIDREGASWSNQIAFERAILSMLQEYPLLEGVQRRYLIDGVLPLPSMREGECYVTLIDGDATYLSIAAASIVAKETHDEWVRTWAKDHVEEAERYDLLSCKGYGTAKHRIAIKTHGFTPLHRKLFLRKICPELAGVVSKPREFMFVD